MERLSYLSVLVVVSALAACGGGGGGTTKVEDQARLAVRDIPKSVITEYNGCRQSLRAQRTGVYPHGAWHYCVSVPVAYNARWAGKIDLLAVPDSAATDKKGRAFWDGREAVLRITSPYRARVDARTQHDKWGMVVEKVVGWGEFVPWISVDLAPFGRRYLHQRITATASLTVRYPKEGDFEFKDTTVSRRRAVSFYIVTPKELVALKRLAPSK